MDLCQTLKIDWTALSPLNTLKSEPKEELDSKRKKRFAMTDRLVFINVLRDPKNMYTNASASVRLAICS